MKIKNKKGAEESLLKTLLWIIFFAIVLVGAYFLIRFLING